MSTEYEIFGEKYSSFDTVYIVIYHGAEIYKSHEIESARKYVSYHKNYVAAQRDLSINFDK